jgi:hypothetical protein
VEADPAVISATYAHRAVLPAIIWQIRFKQGQRMRKVMCGLALAAFAAAVALVPLKASAPSGAIFTTLADGSEVNYNIYQAKEEVYLDGGPSSHSRDLRPRTTVRRSPHFILMTMLTLASSKPSNFRAVARSLV